MYTPHPSLVPIEMAAAGMLTVTNSYGNKTAETLHAISANLIAVAPSVQAVAEGLRYAAAHANDFEGRARGARVKWSTTWDEAFEKTIMARIGEFLERSAEAGAGFLRAA
jgi:hypothetical protein